MLAGLFTVGISRTLEAETVTWNANPEPDIAGYRLFWGEINTTPSVRDVGKTTQAQVTNLIAGRTYTFYLTAYNTAGLESDPSSTVYYSPASPPPPGTVVTTASAVRQDLNTSGYWKGAYGTDGGYAYPGGNLTAPDYVTLSGSGNYGVTWAASTSDTRGLQKRSGTGHFAGAWQNTNTFELYVRLPEERTNQVSFYFVDFDRQDREQLLELYELGTGTILGREVISDFEDGHYSVWNLQGEVGVRIKRLAGPTAVMSGIFFDPVGGASASFASSDMTTSGSWIGQYGSEGGMTSPGGQVAAPAYVQISGYKNYPLTWSTSTSDPRALQKTSGSGRFAGAWHGTNEFYMMFQFQDNKAHQVSFYFVDYDRAGREQRLEILDQTTGNRIEAATISAFENGVWVSYNLKGRVTAKLTRLAGPNAVLSGVFFDPAGGNYAEFVEADTDSSGTWIGTYGGDGYRIATQTASLPNYAILGVDAPAGYWATSTSDPTALQRPSGSGRVASAWVADQQFSARVGIKDGQTHAVSLYFVDFNDQGRNQLVEVIDPTSGLVLDRSELSSFRSGVWLSYDVQGEVIVRITSLNQYTPVLSGVFFD
jgi:hypothetical protein